MKIKNLLAFFYRSDILVELLKEERIELGVTKPLS
jgi:hypothetical protein